MIGANTPPGMIGITSLGSTPPPTSGTPTTGGTAPTTTNYIQQLIDAVNQGGTGQPAQQAADPSAGLQSFFNTPMYQVLYGQNANQADPTQRFQADPGFQFNQEQTAKQMQQLGASKGLLESGNMQVELQKQLQGNQNQQYQTWLGQQGNLYNSYQDRLNGLSQFGSTQTGGQQSYDQGNILGQLLGGYNQQTGQGIAAGNLSTGENISSILGNQGVYNANAYLNTGAAQAQTLMSLLGMNMQAQNNGQLSANTQSAANGVRAGSSSSNGQVRF